MWKETDGFKIYFRERRSGKSQGYFWVFDWVTGWTGAEWDGETWVCRVGKGEEVSHLDMVRFKSLWNDQESRWWAILSF